MCPNIIRILMHKESKVVVTAWFGPLKGFVLTEKGLNSMPLPGSIFTRTAVGFFMAAAAAGCQPEPASTFVCWEEPATYGGSGGITYDKYVPEARTVCAPVRKRTPSVPPRLSGSDGGPSVSVATSNGSSPAPPAPATSGASASSGTGGTSAASGSGASTSSGAGGASAAGGGASTSSGPGGASAASDGGSGSSASSGPDGVAAAGGGSVAVSGPGGVSAASGGASASSGPSGVSAASGG